MTGGGAPRDADSRGDSDLAVTALRALLVAAGPRPWREGDDWPEDIVDATGAYVCDAHGDSGANQALILAAVNALDTLLSTQETLTVLLQTVAERMKPSELAVVAQQMAQAVKVLRERDELQGVIDRTWEASVRGAERWRAGRPEREFTHPDRADLTAWLLDRWDEATLERDAAFTRVKALEDALDEALVEYQDALPYKGVFAEKHDDAATLARLRKVLHPDGAKDAAGG